MPAGIFTENKYTKWYFARIEKCRERGWTKRNRPADTYTETHHVVPRALGGTDNLENLVELTWREHVHVHWLLTKMTTGNDRAQMEHAFHGMVNCKNTDYRKKRYELITIARKKKKRAMTGENNPWYGRGGEMKGPDHPNYGKPGPNLGKKFNEMWRKNLSLAKRGHLNPMYGSKSPMKGKKHGEETCQKMSETARRRMRDTQCEHCGAWHTKQHYAAWHGEKCKKRSA